MVTDNPLCKSKSLSISTFWLGRGERVSCISSGCAADSAVLGGVGSGVGSGNAPGSFAFGGEGGVGETRIVTCGTLSGTVLFWEGVAAGVNSFAGISFNAGEKGFSGGFVCTGDGCVTTVDGIGAEGVTGGIFGEISGDIGGDAGGDDGFPIIATFSAFGSPLFLRPLAS